MTQYKEIDIEGLETLEAISEAEKLNDWMYQTIRPFCKGKILEIGSGIGNISEFFIKNFHDITLSDLRENYRDILKQKFFESNIIELNLVAPDFKNKYQDQIGQYDTVFALNVIEHIKDDMLSIENCYSLLKPGGNIIILVPAYQTLYNRFDEELEHYRRYNKKLINKILVDNNFKILHSQYFNFVGIIGWYFSGKIQKNKTIPKNQISVYNKLVPLFKIIDSLIMNRIGLSVISVGKK
jgi:SAM-dependent methyltransferase